MRVELPFEITLRTYYEDTDLAGVVYYANYLRFFERARTEWLRQLGIQNRQMKETNGGVFVVAECHVKYLKPAVMDDLLTIRIDSVQAGRASANFNQSIWRANEALLCTAKVRIAYMDATTQRLRVLPDELASNN
jgi:acyl-CoA thioester hydrolase